MTFVVSLTMLLILKGHGVIRGRCDLLYDNKVHGDLCRRFNVVYDPKRPRVIIFLLNLLYDPKGHSDLCCQFDLVNDPKRSRCH